MILGEDVIIQFRLSSIDFADFICATECVIEGVTETTSAATLGTGSWNRLVPLTNGYKITLAGIIPLEGSIDTTNNATALFQAWMNKTPVKFRMFFTQNDPFWLRVLEGEALITTSSLAGPSTGFATSNFTLDGTRPLVMGSAICAATAGTISGSGNFIFSGIPVDTASIYYEMFRNDVPYRTGSITPVGGSASLGFIGLPAGNYKIIFYPLCVDGLSGTAQQRTWTE